MVKNQPARAGDVRDAGLIPKSGRCPGEGSGNPLQYSFLANSICRGIWWAPVHGVTKSQAWLIPDEQTHTQTHTYSATALSSLQVPGTSFTCTFIFKFCESKRLHLGSGNMGDAYITCWCFLYFPNVLPCTHITFQVRKYLMLLVYFLKAIWQQIE